MGPPSALGQLLSDLNAMNQYAMIFIACQPSGSSTATTLLPQERILEYLMFEVGTCVIAQ